MESTNNYNSQLTRSLQSQDNTARKANFIRSQSGISNLQMISAFKLTCLSQRLPIRYNDTATCSGMG